MESHGAERDAENLQDLASNETPEDVAVLYSWANLHGAKYRDFSASRREYRAQLRHRAAEQVREQALQAQAAAEAAAAAAEAAARQASLAARSIHNQETESVRQQSLREAEEAARTAAAERVEAARRAEAAALAENVARKEAREITDAHASAQRQAARYADSEIRRRANVGSGREQVPGQMSDPYTAPSPQFVSSAVVVASPLRVTPANPAPLQQPVARSVVPASTPEPPIAAAAPSTMGEPQSPSPTIPGPATTMSTSDSENKEPSAPAPEREYRPSAPNLSAIRRPQGYRPDDASGVRQIYRGPEFHVPAEEVESASSLPITPPAPQSSTPTDVSRDWSTMDRFVDRIADRRAPVRSTAQQPEPRTSPAAPETAYTSNFLPTRPTQADAALAEAAQANLSMLRPAQSSGIPANRPQPFTPPPALPLPTTPFAQSLMPTESSRGRRVQDDVSYQQPPAYSDPPRRSTVATPSEPVSVNPPRQTYTADPAGPAWLYAPATPAREQKPLAPATSQSSVADTLQHSRERVAARWFALKGVFEQPGSEPEATPVRQKETRTPVLAVFSFAGGVGKTSLVATVGRTLSSMGEKVLLTDTTSHGLLPFYFGASELRHGTVRTFSPPSGSTDAPIYLVSYEVDNRPDEDAQDHLVEEIASNSRGTHRILLDLTPTSGWLVRSMARMNPTILVPVAPDMNSVISLQAVEKFFQGITDADGRPLQPYYLLNQFDASLPLHLDVREVLRRQLGDRLLPFVIRRAPAVSEALAEGMTIVDYAPDAPVAEDYLNVATWLRTVAAPATAGFRNVRWSER